MLKHISPIFIGIVTNALMLHGLVSGNKLTQALAVISLGAFLFLVDKTYGMW